MVLYWLGGGAAGVVTFWNLKLPRQGIRTTTFAAQLSRRVVVVHSSPHAIQLLLNSIQPKCVGWLNDGWSVGGWLHSIQIRYFHKVQMSPTLTLKSCPTFVCSIIFRCPHVAEQTTSICHLSLGSSGGGEKGLWVHSVRRLEWYIRGQDPPREIRIAFRANGKDKVRWVDHLLKLN